MPIDSVEGKFTLTPWFIINTALGISLSFAPYSANHQCYPDREIFNETTGESMSYLATFSIFTARIS